MAEKYNFARKQLKDFPDAVQPLPNEAKSVAVLPGSEDDRSSHPTSEVGSDKTKEQLKLERANAINEVLSKRILKGKGPIYDELERSVRHYLNSELGKIFGSSAPAGQQFTAEEAELLKFFVQRLKQKND